jgi:hypothetical protein
VRPTEHVGEATSREADSLTHSDSGSTNRLWPVVYALTMCSTGRWVMETHSDDSQVTCVIHGSREWPIVG